MDISPSISLEEVVDDPFSNCAMEYKSPARSKISQLSPEANSYFEPWGCFLNKRVF